MLVPEVLVFGELPGSQLEEGERLKRGEKLGAAAGDSDIGGTRFCGGIGDDEDMVRYRAARLGYLLRPIPAPLPQGEKE